MGKLQRNEQTNPEIARSPTLPRFHRGKELAPCTNYHFRNTLIRNFRRLGLTRDEVVFILINHSFWIYKEYPPALKEEYLTDLLGLQATQTRKLKATLLQKGMLNLIYRYHHKGEGIRRKNCTIDWTPLVKTIHAIMSDKHVDRVNIRPSVSGTVLHRHPEREIKGDARLKDSPAFKGTTLQKTNKHTPRSATEEAPKRTTNLRENTSTQGTESRVNLKRRFQVDGVQNADIGFQRNIAKSDSILITSLARSTDYLKPLRREEKNFKSPPSEVSSEPIEAKTPRELPKLDKSSEPVEAKTLRELQKSGRPGSPSGLTLEDQVPFGNPLPVEQALPEQQEAEAQSLPKTAWGRTPRQEEPQCSTAPEASPLAQRCRKLEPIEAKTPRELRIDRPEEKPEEMKKRENLEKPEENQTSDLAKNLKISQKTTESETQPLLSHSERLQRAKEATKSAIGTSMAGLAKQAEKRSQASSTRLEKKLEVSTTEAEKSKVMRGELGKLFLGLMLKHHNDKIYPKRLNASDMKSIEMLIGRWGYEQVLELLQVIIPRWVEITTEMKLRSAPEYPILAFIAACDQGFMKVKQKNIYSAVAHSTTAPMTLEQARIWLQANAGKTVPAEVIAALRGK